RRATDRRQDHSRHSNGEMTMSRERRRLGIRSMDNQERDGRLYDGAVVAIAAAVITVIVAACASTTLADADVAGGAGVAASAGAGVGPSASATTGAAARVGEAPEADDGGLSSADALGSLTVGAPEAGGLEEVIVTGNRVSSAQAQRMARAQTATG